MPAAAPTADASSTVHHLRRVGVGVLACVCLALSACSPTPRTTRIAVADYEAMAVAMGQSLAASEAIRGRGPDSERWMVSIDKVTNLTSDVMSVGEQWSIVEQVRSALPMVRLGDTKNIYFTVPAERRRDEALLSEQAGVTHQMTATFRSATRATERGRTELYYCEFELIDLREGRPVWVDAFEYKRSARGRMWD